MRLDQFLSLASIGTRKKVKEYIYEGKVTLNGVACLIPATMIQEQVDIIHYQNQIVNRCPVYYVLNKPQNCITARDIHNHTVFDCLKNIDTKGLFAVGRLDKDTEGLLFLTNDGEFNHTLMNPEHHIEKTYFFLCLGKLSTDEIKELESGTDIGVTSLTKPARIHIIKTGLYKDLAEEIGIEKMKNIKKQPDNQIAFLGKITIVEGKKHQVKRMLRKMGCPVIYLKRIAIGRYELPKDMPIGHYLEVSKETIMALLNLESDEAIKL